MIAGLSTSGKVQAVINTIESLENVPVTFNNVNKLTGTYQTLFEISEEVKKLEAELLKYKKQDKAVEKAAEKGSDNG